MLFLLFHCISAELTGYGPFASRDVKRAIKAHVESVYGECLYKLSAATPADTPQECPGTPSTCPNPGLWGKHPCLLTAPSLHSYHMSCTGSFPLVMVAG